jgi:anhydro-N-acetylmuramic acid kinase
VALLRAIGLMSGTSMDGIDVALLETDGERVARFGISAIHFYNEQEQALLRRALEAARTLRDRSARPGVIAEAERMITILHGAAVETYLVANDIDRKSIDVVGFHGHTILHRPQDRLTIQIGDGPALAKELGIEVVYDLRAADVAAGGQGAPLVPVYHRALAATLDRPHPIAVLNLGGVANVTYIDGTSEPIACDTGPANALIDDFMCERTAQSHDPDGSHAAKGKVDDAAVARALAHPFFALKPPKSLDRNDFRSWIEQEAALGDQSVEDGAATLTAITAASIAAIVKFLPRPPQSWVVAGGGAHNKTMMRMLSQRLAPAKVETANAVGWSVNAMEAQAFAFLAVRSLRSLPLTFPGTTGVPKPLTGGVRVKP